ncbi:amino acid permease 6 [Amborella trichopoda]|uniref:Amino acid transporter transmembrane domain-containing protein n=1 Tax=Amborella trichopoda TaxID=13333 RepID=U5DCU8_AMBTC|nr:amino acid permease 6 [Amborella trichopoda]ERN20020.1 hypothetical protein AMTR_s00071p00166670 [Amborella trichopoda]|eukprot:XP_006858553.3 amino acid permease 6 [Amborella trichopoda]
MEMEMDEVMAGRAFEDEEDDHKREGTVWTATAHVITAVIGSGVLALGWSVAQLGWMMGPLTVVAFAWVTYYTANLLSDCHRSPHPTTGHRNHTYIDAVRACLGPQKVLICGVAQYSNLVGTLIGYTITSAISMMAIKRSDCFHENGHNSRCGVSGNLYVALFGVLEVILSQLPSLEKISWLSILAAIMSFAYSFIGLGLSIAMVICHGDIRGTLFGVKVGINDIPLTARTWNAFQALGNIAFAYTYALVLIEIQDTLKSSPPENKAMKRASLYGIGITAIFYFSIGSAGYAAFGNDAPGNMLTGFGFYEPFWLIDIANLFIVIHLVGAYQVFSQPVFAAWEMYLSSKWSQNSIVHSTYNVKLPLVPSTSFNFTLSKLISRTLLVIIVTLVAMTFPFFNAVNGLIGAIAFWPLQVYFPTTMYISQMKVKKGTQKWIFLKTLSVCCFFVSLIAVVGSVAGIVDSLKHATPFQTMY